MHAYKKRMEILNVLYVYCTWKYLHAISIHDYVVHQLARKVYHFQFSPEFVSLPMWLSFQIGRVGLNCMVLSGAHMSSSTAYTNMNTCVHRSFFFSFSHLSYIHKYKKKYGKIWVHVNLVHPRFNTTTGPRQERVPLCMDLQTFGLHPAWGNFGQTMKNAVELQTSELMKDLFPAQWFAKKDRHMLCVVLWGSKMEQEETIFFQNHPG